ncbi:MAG: glutamate synthase-related protein [Deltaproteobacteria bacterium]|nr:glutamate synthase-related protein [Deltaproteobacteria bacterium]
MPSKYVINTQTVPHRFKPITRSGIVAWEEGCLKCAVCVKKTCVYGVYDHRRMDPVQMVDTIDTDCMNCLRCVQGCPKELIHKTVNPEYLSLGDGYWTPDIITKLWAQAQSGKIPVSGAGYPGPFTGPGFDAMWTDMSEIVRPTRDGIHGREYISTAIDVGRTPKALVFDDTGMPKPDDARFMDIPLPILFRMPTFGSMRRDTIRGWAEAARVLGTLLALPEDRLASIPADLYPWIMPMCSVDVDPKDMDMPQTVRLVEIPWHEKWAEQADRIRSTHPDVILSINVPITKGVEETVLSLVENRVAVVHLSASEDGVYCDDASLYLKDGIRAVHLKLVEAGQRDEMTLLISGGIAMAEHVPKAIICGGDGVMIDFPLLIALECRMCRRCTKGLQCPVEIEKATTPWVRSRVVNLMGAWHNQLLEVMGAMGIRDARRLRGEAGRAMFFETLNEEIFGAMGVVEEGCELE